MNRLPPELWESIAVRALDVGPAEAPWTQADVLPFTLVCREWRTWSDALLHRHISLTHDSRECNALSRLRTRLVRSELSGDPLGAYVQTLALKVTNSGLWSVVLEHLSVLFMHAPKLHGLFIHPDSVLVPSSLYAILPRLSPNLSHLQAVINNRSSLAFIGKCSNLHELSIWLNDYSTTSETPDGNIKPFILPHLARLTVGDDASVIPVAHVHRKRFSLIKLLSTCELPALRHTTFYGHWFHPFNLAGFSRFFAVHAFADMALVVRGPAFTQGGFLPMQTTEVLVELPSSIDIASLPTSVHTITLASHHNHSGFVYALLESLLQSPTALTHVRTVRFALPPGAHASSQQQQQPPHERAFSWRAAFFARRTVAMDIGTAAFCGNLLLFSTELARHEIDLVDADGFVLRPQMELVKRKPPPPQHPHPQQHLLLPGVNHARLSPLSITGL